MAKAIGVYRELKLAGKPGSDQKILDLTAEEIKKLGFETSIVSPENFLENQKIDFIFSMARGEKINNILSKYQKNGVFVINSPESIRLSFDRKTTYKKMIELGANVPNIKIAKTDNLKFTDFKDKSILKPSNRHEFWFIVENENDFEKAIQEYKNQNIKEIIVQKFIDGKHIKYYVIDEEIILPKNIENEISKEAIDKIKKESILTKKATGLKIFGGDFIIDGDNSFCVDTNDWPSMGSISGFTQEEAAFKIACLIQKEYNNFIKK